MNGEVFHFDTSNTKVSKKVRLKTTRCESRHEIDHYASIQWKYHQLQVEMGNGWKSNLSKTANIPKSIEISQMGNHEYCDINRI